MREIFANIARGNVQQRAITTTLPNLPPENRELFLISELHKIKNPFSLFRQQAANFQISTI